MSRGMIKLLVGNGTMRSNGAPEGEIGQCNDIFFENVDDALHAELKRTRISARDDTWLEGLNVMARDGHVIARIGGFQAPQEQMFPGLAGMFDLHSLDKRQLGLIIQVLVHQLGGMAVFDEFEAAEAVPKELKVTEGVDPKFFKLELK